MPSSSDLSSAEGVVRTGPARWKGVTIGAAMMVATQLISALLVTGVTLLEETTPSLFVLGASTLVSYVATGASAALLSSRLSIVDAAAGALLVEGTVRIVHGDC